MATARPDAIERHDATTKAAVRVSATRLATRSTERRLTSDQGSPPRAKTIGSKLAVVSSTGGTSSTRKSSPWIATQSERLALACASASAGLRACAKFTRSEAIAVQALALATEQEALAGEARRIGRELGVSLGRIAGMAESRRWEWLASTSLLLDGTSDPRLLDECRRCLSAGTEAARCLTLVSASGAIELAIDLERVLGVLVRAARDVERLEADALRS